VDLHALGRSRVRPGHLAALLGIIFLPLTRLLYVILWNTGGRGVTGWEWIFVVFALFGDLASYGGFGRQRGAF
jgi:hypothetical protein